MNFDTKSIHRFIMSLLMCLLNLHGLIILGGYTHVMRRPCWCTKQWQNVAQVLHNNRIKVPKDFFRYCSVHQHGRRDVTWKPRIEDFELVLGVRTSETHGWRKTENERAKRSLNNNRTPARASETRKRYQRFLHRGKLGFRSTAE